MRVLVAFDKFKDALTAAEACAAAAAELRERHPGWAVAQCPLADGGEGFASILTAAAEGQTCIEDVMGPQGVTGSARYGRVEARRVPEAVRRQLGGLAAGTQELAVIEMAAASGLALVPVGHRDVWSATTVGTGQLIKAAAEARAAAILLGVGGSATHDLGLGALAALGLEFLDAAGEKVHPPYPKDWHRIVRIAGRICPLPPLFIACDVANPLLGPRGAATVYGPQKGLKPEDLARLEAETARMASLLGEGTSRFVAAKRNRSGASDGRPGGGAATEPGSSAPEHGADVEAPSSSPLPVASGTDARTIPGAGAAGGISFGFMVAAGARLVPGAGLISDWLDLDRKVREADLVITGEGRFDDSSIEGKGPGSLARAALAQGKKVLVLAGNVALSAPPPAPMEVVAITPPGTPLPEALQSTEVNLRRIVRTLRNGLALFALLVVLTLPARAFGPTLPPSQVRLGIDVLEESNFLVLRGKRIGLLTHPAGVDRHGAPTVEVLRRAPGVKLVALFATEHGIWNTMPGGKNFPDMTDPRTGLPVYSLYNGRTHVPTAKQLRGLDALVIDLQDIGVRSYTFSGTMKTAMEGCFQNHVEVIVLDRPNPLGGLKVSGPMLDPNLLGVSLVCEFPVPYVHGLTIGELAQLAKGTPGVLQVKPADLARGRLTVVPMAGWRRSMRWPETGLNFTQTSPEISDFASVMGYAMTGLGCDLGHFRHGVGHQYWFRGLSNTVVKPEVVGRALHALHLPGIDFRLISAPSGRTGEPGTGWYIEVTDWDEWRPAELSFYLMRLACELEPRNPFVNTSKDDGSRFLHEMGSAGLFRDLAAHGAKTNIEAYLERWREEDRRYQEDSRRFWLYR